ncbi:MAG: type II toxin-antitoxin system RelE/ParE family toxin [Thermoanaerobaculia bacterium]
MSKPLRTEEEAEDELSEAIRRYEERRAGLGEELLVAVDTALARIAMLPGSGAPVPQVPPELRIRRMPVQGFPYRVVYLETPEAIRVVAFAHIRRRPGYWLPRLRFRR